MSKLKIVHTAMLVISMVNCTTIPKEAYPHARSEKIKNRAAFDLGCNKEQVTTIEIDPTTMGAKCSNSGKQATYFFEGTHCYDFSDRSVFSFEKDVPAKVFEHNCRAVLNNKSSK